MALSIFNHDKGQAFAPDFMASLAVMGVMLTAFFISWNTMIDSQITAAEDKDLYAKGQKTVKSLISAPGTPENWGSENVTSVGLAEKPHVLDKERLDKFVELSYSKQRSLLNTQGFNLKITGDGEKLYQTGDTISGDQVNTFTRYAMLNRSGSIDRVEVTYTVWE